MKPVKYNCQIVARTDLETRKVAEMLAERENLSLGEAVRQLLHAGIVAKGLG